MLVGKLRGIGAAGTDLPDVELLHLLEREPNKGNAGRGDIVAVGAAREVGIEPAFVGNDEHAIARHTDVEFQRIDPHRKRIGE
jgi:hypothetical protein